MDLFTSREIAIFLWALGGILFFLFKKDVRRSFFGVIKAFFHWRLLLYVALSGLYFTTVLFGLNLVFPLNPSLLKDAALWFLFAGLVATGRSIGSKKVDLLQDHFFDNFKFTVVFEFVVASYVFPLSAELVLVPVVTFIAMMEAYSKTKEEYAQVRKVLTFLLFGIGLGMLGFSVYSAILDYNNLIGLSSVKGFLLPFLLMVFYFPLTYIWVLKATYDRLFVPIRVIFKNVKKPKVGKYLRRRIFFHCWFSTKKLQKILDNKFGFWHSIETIEGAKDFMKCVKTNGYFGERYDIER